MRDEDISTENGFYQCYGGNNMEVKPHGFEKVTVIRAYALSGLFMKI